MYKKRVDAIKYQGWIATVIIPLILSLVVMNMVIPLISQTLGILILKPNDEIINPLTVLVYVITLVLSIILSMLASRLSFEDLGLERENIIKNMLYGSIYGFIAISIVAFIINILGGVKTTIIFKPEYISFILMAIAMFIFQSTFEEFVYRSYLMPHLSKKVSGIASILITSILFVGLHLSNPGMTTFPVLNLFLAGLVFGLMYYIWGNLWLNGLAHALWNFSQGIIYGSLVSGNFISKAVMSAMPIEGKNMISGGAFGFEGSIITSILGIILVIVLLKIAKNKNLDLSLKLK